MSTVRILAEGFFVIENILESSDQEIKVVAWLFQFKTEIDNIRMKCKETYLISNIMIKFWFLLASETADISC